MSDFDPPRFRYGVGAMLWQAAAATMPQVDQPETYQKRPFDQYVAQRFLDRFEAFCREAERRGYQTVSPPPEDREVYDAWVIEGDGELRRLASGDHSTAWNAAYDYDHEHQDADITVWTTKTWVQQVFKGYLPDPDEIPVPFDIRGVPDPLPGSELVIDPQPEKGITFGSSHSSDAPDIDMSDQGEPH